MKNYLRTIILALALHTWVGAQEPATIPTLKGENLERETFQFPKDLKQKNVVLVAGFSQGSSGNLEKCLLKLDKDFPGIAFSAVMLESVPSFIRPRVKKAMRAKVPQSRKARYLLFFEGQKALEQLVDYNAKNKDDAYLIGLRSKKTDAYVVSFRTHGNCDDSSYETIKKSIESMLSSSL